MAVLDILCYGNCKSPTGNASEINIQTVLRLMLRMQSGRGDVELAMLPMLAAVHASNPKAVFISIFRLFGGFFLFVVFVFYFSVKIVRTVIPVFPSLAMILITSHFTRVSFSYEYLVTLYHG